MAVALLTALAGALRFTNLGLQSLWVDEALTAHVLDPSLPETFDRLRERESTPPLYYALTWLWTRVLGEGDVALRSLSALLGTATVPVVYAAGARLASRLTGVAAAALVATSPYLIWYSQEARSYAPAMLLAALSILFLAAATQPVARRRDLALWAITCSLLVATHYLSVVLIAAEALWLLRQRGLTRAPLAALAAPVATGLLLAPLALSQQSADWISDISLHNRLDETPRQFVGGYGGAPGSGLGLAAGLLVAAGLVLLAWRARDDERRGGLLALGIAATAFAATLLLALVGLDYVYHRNLLVAWIPLAIAVASGFAAARTAGIAATAVLCAVFLTSHFGIVRDSDRHRADWESAVGALGRAEQPRPIAIWPTFADTELTHYGVPVVDEPDDSVRAREIVVIGENLDGAVLAPGRRIGPFEVVERRIGHTVTTAILRARRPHKVELGLIHRGDTLGAPAFNVLLDPGTGAGGSD
ncbi:MAG: mannosyltransferase [Thermoleophilaceae bacterium]|nr:mannosyltransferase [Thermoleophilaceae bacterium]